MMTESLKLLNIHGVVTVWPGKANVIAVAVRTNQRSIEKMMTATFDPAKKPSPGAQQLLFGAYVDIDGMPEINTYQIGPLEPDLFSIQEVKDLLEECLFSVIDALSLP